MPSGEPPSFSWVETVFGHLSKPTGVTPAASSLGRGTDGHVDHGHRQQQALTWVWKPLGTWLSDLVGRLQRKPELIPTSSPPHPQCTGEARECCSPKPLGHFLSVHVIEYYSI